MCIIEKVDSMHRDCTYMQCMYDDLTLIPSSPDELQGMFNIFHSYAKKWQYSINADKSAVMVFGESAKSRRSGQEHRKWCLGGDLISETDEQHHLGILSDVCNSTIHRTNERCSAARSAFYSLNSIGTHFVRLHPLTSLHLYRALSLPILLYGSEIWTLSKSELLSMERLHRKILHTIFPQDVSPLHLPHHMVSNLWSR